MECIAPSDAIEMNTCVPYPSARFVRERVGQFNSGTYYALKLLHRPSLHLPSIHAVESASLPKFSPMRYLDSAHHIPFLFSQFGTRAKYFCSPHATFFCPPCLSIGGLISTNPSRQLSHRTVAVLGHRSLKSQASSPDLKDHHDLRS